MVKIFLGKWLIFIQERFPLVYHVPMIISYWAVNALVAMKSCAMPVDWSDIRYGSLGIIFLIFFHLRIFDEIKDCAHDKKVNPTRPLARGLISLGQAKGMAIVLIAGELALSFQMGWAALWAMAMVICYSFMMYKEFFIGAWLRPRLATYALAHTLVSCAMACFIFAGMTGRYFWQAPGIFILFIFVNWMLFNIFEFGRKIFGPEEEHSPEDSYSNRLGPVRAAFNVWGMSAVAVSASCVLGISWGFGRLFFVSILLLFFIVVMCSLLYGHFNNGFWAKCLRAVSSMFILFYSLIHIIGLLH